MVGTGEGLEPGGSGDSSSSSASQLQPSGTADPEPGSEPGSEGLINPDTESYFLSTPPVLLVAAYRFMAPASNSLVWVPLLSQLTDGWRERELTDVSILVARLFFWHGVMQRREVLLSALLGGIDVGDLEMSLCSPGGHFSVCEVTKHDVPMHPAQLHSMVGDMNMRWAFQGPGNPGLDSWLLLRQNDETGRIVALSIHSKRRKAETCMQPGKFGEEARKILDIPGVDSMLIYVTDEHQPESAQTAAKSIVPNAMVMVDCNALPAYYRACIAMLKICHSLPL